MTNNDETPGDKREAELVDIIRQHLFIPTIAQSVDAAIEMEKTQALAIARAILAKQTSEVGEWKDMREPYQKAHAKAMVDYILSGALTKQTSNETPSEDSRKLLQALKLMWFFLPSEEPDPHSRKRDVIEHNKRWHSACTIYQENINKLESLAKQTSEVGILKQYNEHLKESGGGLLSNIDKATLAGIKPIANYHPTFQVIGDSICDNAHSAAEELGMPRVTVRDGEE